MKETLPDVLRIHATCVTWRGKGVLLSGPSGAGKSDLALRLVDAGAELVADDQVEVHASEAGLMASAPASLHGLLEVRGLGIFVLPAVTEAAVHGVVELDAGTRERLPEAEETTIMGVVLPFWRVDPTSVSAVARVRCLLIAERRH